MASFLVLWEGGRRSLEKWVQDRLQKLGYQIDCYSDYKIDLAVVHPDNPSRYILAIETDGERFTSANSMIERFKRNCK